MKNILIYDDNAADAQTLKEYIMNIEKIPQNPSKHHYK